MLGRTARRAAVAAVCLGAALGGSASPVHAVERENHLGAGIGPGFFDASGSAPIGGGVEAHYTYGLSDAFDLLAEGSWSTARFGGGGSPAARTRPSWVFTGGVGATYVFDVLQWVPYAGILVEAATLSGGPLGRTKVLPDAVLAVGLDYRLGPSWAVGVAARQHMFFTEASTYPSDTQVLARFEYTWGW